MSEENANCAVLGPVGGRPLKGLFKDRRDDSYCCLDAIGMASEMTGEFVWLLDSGFGIDMIRIQIDWQVEDGWGEEQ